MIWVFGGSSNIEALKKLPEQCCTEEEVRSGIGPDEEHGATHPCSYGDASAGRLQSVLSA
ncbi:hypothetical protein [Arthrobacter pityocampae]|uniref:hypothetical protein n=1 Tax=Arthrobacter pityocampae TaxID=547334 RepID=UPI0011B0ACD0|nr:hypothetical protein [Arthrobacter pityocampae]